MHAKLKDDDFVKLSPETLSYYRRVSETLKTEFGNDEDPESKALFIQNVFSQLCNESDLVAVTQHQTASRLLEPLITLAPADHLFHLFLALRPHWLAECKHKFASHVLQTILTTCGTYLNRVSGCSTATQASIEPTQTEISQPTQHEETAPAIAYDNLRNLFLEFCAFLLRHFPEVLYDKYAGHIVRVVLEVLGGVSVSEGVIRSRLSRQGQIKNKPSLAVHAMQLCSKDFRKQLYILCKHLIKLPELEAAVKDAVVNPIIQTMLLVLHKRNPAKCSKYCHKILNKLHLDVIIEGDTSEQQLDRLGSLPAVVEDQVASYLVEQLIMLSCSTSDGDDHLFTGLFQHRILVFALHPVANYVLQKFLLTIAKKDQLKEIMSELCDHLEQILYLNHVWVIVRLAEACVRLRTCQRRLIKSLMVAMHCYEPKCRRDKLLPLLASLSTFDVFYGEGSKADSSSALADDKDEQQQHISSSQMSADEPGLNSDRQLTSFNYHGSIILQHLLQLVDTKPLVSGFLKLSPAELVRMAMDPCGSHVVESYFQSGTVGEKSKHTAACNKLKDQWTEIACSRHGSRMLEALWKELTINDKFSIAKELSQHHDRIKTDQFGRYIHRNLSLHYFIHRRSDWKQMQGSAAKKMKLFEDVISLSKGKKASITVAGEESCRRIPISEVQQSEGEIKVIEDRVQIDELFTVRRKKTTFDEKLHNVNQSPSQSEKIKLGKRKR